MPPFCGATIELSLGGSSRTKNSNTTGKEICLKKIGPGPCCNFQFHEKNNRLFVFVKYYILHYYLIYFTKKKLLCRLQIRNVRFDTKDENKMKQMNKWQKVATPSPFTKSFSESL